ncbi:hypothetical protein ACFW9O_12355 [Streptomyces sp. NPDC059499]|uniref:hypothetical protein n=1 Tax=Streptomyces sp. NPDC059499 TaxID=3346852 RepID=UPI0036CCCA5F
MKNHFVGMFPAGLSPAWSSSATCGDRVSGTIRTPPRSSSPSHLAQAGICTTDRLLRDLVPHREPKNA